MRVVPISELINEKGEVISVSSVGGYGVTYIGRDHDDVLCPDCVNAWSSEGIRENVVGGFTHWEGASLTCDGCGCEIESEYGEV